MKHITCKWISSHLKVCVKLKDLGIFSKRLQSDAQMCGHIILLLKLNFTTNTFTSSL